MRKNKLIKLAGMSAAMILAFSSMTAFAAENNVYITQRGDNLSKIAQNIYGDKTRWKDIYEANRDVIKDPNIIWANQSLVIPDAVVENPQNTPDTQASWPEISPEWQAAGQSYVEQNGLTFYQGTSFQTQGYRYNPDDLARYEFIGTDGNINSITIQDADKEGYQVVTISSAMSGSIAEHEWGEDPLSYIMMSGVSLCDVYTGRLFPSVNTNGDVELVNTIDLVWGDISYSVDYIKQISWTWGGWTDWDDDGNAYEMAVCNSTTTVVVPKGYDGLALIVAPRTEGPSADMEYNVFDNETEKYILEDWKEGTYLIRVSDAYNLLNGQ